MDKFDKHLIHCSAVDKLNAQIINAKFMVEDAQRDIKDGLYGGVTRAEMDIVLNGLNKEVEIFQYMLDTIINNVTKTN